MKLDEPVVEDTVSINENDVVGSGGAHGFIDDDRFAESVVLVPDMLYRQGEEGTVCLNQRTNARAGTVIGDNYLKIPTGLILKAD
jgi:hypothetical protein